MLVLIVGLAVLLAACGSSSKSGSRLGHAQRIGLDVPEDLRRGGDRRVPRRRTPTSRSTTPAAARARARATSRPRPSTSPAPTACRSPRTSRSTRAATLLYFPTVAAPITVSYNLQRREGPAALRQDARQDLRREDHQVERHGDRGRQPGRDPAEHHDHGGAPGRRLGNHEQLHEVPHCGRPHRLDARQRRHRRLARSGTQAGTGNAGVAQIVQQTDGAIGYVDLADANEVEAARSRRSRTRPARSSPRRSPARRRRSPSATINADLTYDPINAPGADAYPITSPTWILVYAKQTDKAKGTALKTFLQFVYDKGEGARGGEQLRRPPGRPWCRRPSRSSASSRSRVAAVRGA